MNIAKLALVIFGTFAAIACDKDGLAPKSASIDQGLNRADRLKCLKPYEGALTGLFTHNQNELFQNLDWDQSKNLRSTKLQLNQNLHAIRYAEIGSSFTGRSLIYQDFDGSRKLIGFVADHKELRYDHPSLQLIPDTNWLESKECVGAGTGMATYWSRYWIINDYKIVERLAVPTSGHQNMDYSVPWREFILEPIPSKTSDGEIVFKLQASCELVYTTEGKEEASSIVLPEIHKTIYFKEDDNGKMILNEQKSDVTLREFQILTDTQLEYGIKFWEVYGDNIELMAQSKEGASLRSWMDANNDTSLAIPDKIRLLLSH